MVREIASQFKPAFIQKVLKETKKARKRTGKKQITSWSEYAQKKIKKCLWKLYLNPNQLFQNVFNGMKEATKET